MSFDRKIASDLFDAAIDESRWVSLLDRLNDQVGALSGGVISVSMAGAGGFQAVWGSSKLTTDVIKAYNERFSQFEASGIPIIRSSERFQVLSEDDLWPEEHDLRGRPDFVGLREMLGIDHRIVARLNEDMSWFNTYTVQFAVGRGPATEAERAAFSAYLPFVAQTVKLANVFTQLKARFRAVLGALDRFAVPVAIVDPAGRIAVANESADVIMAKDCGLDRDLAGRIRLSDPDAHARLLDAVRAAAATGAGEGDAPEAIFNAPRRSGEDPFCLEVSPLRDTDREIGRGFVGALVKIYDPTYHPIIRIDAFASVYGLTDSEMGVAMLLVNGAGTEEIAEIRGTTPGTARLQIKSILSKTGCATRTDLVRRALSAHLPIRKDDAPKTG
ncbi:MAG: helix-turn-helix transcriptional regulator [Marivibrio sp.]|uniref:helix-turn-helix transcriptional regulator n=1 Tax=Marivibrio sp. TaxID=2039719 RepID=UPI0032EBBAF2